MSQMILPKLSESRLTDEDLQILCGVCDEKSAILVWDDRYAGYRGRCSLCEYDWPES